MLSRARRSALILASTALLAGSLAACSGDVEIDSGDVPANDVAACRSLLDDLPSTLAGEPRRAVEPHDALGAAWGDPALVLECGTTMPASFDDFAQCAVLNDVQWYVPDREQRDPSTDITIHTLGYEPVVSLLVPAEHRDRSDSLLHDLGLLVEEHLDLVNRCE